MKIKLLWILGMAISVWGLTWSIKHYRATHHPAEPYYRLYLYDDSMSLMDGDKVVKRFPYDSSELSKTVLEDNR